MPNIIDTLITDRTKADVDRANYLNSLWRDDGTYKGTQAEYDEWFDGPRGEYRPKDLNRIEGAVEFLYDFLRVRGFPPAITTIKTDWDDIDVPIIDASDRILDNVQAIRDAIPVFPTTPQVPQSLDYMTIRKANDIEQILLDAYTVGLNSTKATLFSGMIYSGQF